MILETKRRAVTIAIALIAIVAISMLTIPAVINPPPQRKLIYQYNTLSAQVYPEYHRAYITIDAPADLYIEFTISNVRDSEDYLYLKSEFYECDLATFDSHFSTNMSDPVYQEFRLEYIRFGSTVSPQHFDDVFFRDVQEGSFTFVWWISAQNKVNSWPLSFTLYLQYK